MWCQINTGDYLIKHKTTQTNSKNSLSLSLSLPSSFSLSLSLHLVLSILFSSSPPSPPLSLSHPHFLPFSPSLPLSQRISCPKYQLKLCEWIRETFSNSEPSPLSLNDLFLSPFPLFCRYFCQSNTLTVYRNDASFKLLLSTTNFLGDKTFEVNSLFEIFIHFKQRIPHLRSIINQTNSWK